MTDADENLKLQKITKLLEKGGTMLANHHECGSPMFRYQGKVLCPVCEGQIVQKNQGKNQEIKSEIIREMNPEIRPEIRRESKPGDRNNIKIGYLVKNKMQDISESLGSETDLQRVKDKLECIGIGLRILRILED